MGDLILLIFFRLKYIFKQRFLILCIFVSISTPIVYAKQCDSSQKLEAERQAISLRNQIVQNLRERDVESEVILFQRNIDRCNLDLANFGLGPGVYSFWKRESWKAQIQKLEKELDYYSDYRDVSDELKDLSYYASKLGITKDIEVYKNRSQKAVLENKKKCSNIDLRNDVLGSPRNQDSVGWCSSFTAADLLSYKVGFKVSAFDVALAYNEETKPQYKKNLLDLILFQKGQPYKTNEQKGGDAPNNANAAIKNGLCREDRLPSEDVGTSNLYYAIQELEGYKESFEGSEEKICPNINESLIKSMFPSTTIKSFYDILKESSEAYFTDDLADKSCGKRVHPKNLTAKSLTAKLNPFVSTSDLFDKIDEQLNKNNILSVGYDARVLYDIHGEGRSMGHDSVIVGRKFNEESGECEFLIRNSWGRSCSSYDSRIECDEGNIYLPKSELNKRIRDVGYIE